MITSRRLFLIGVLLMVAPYLGFPQSIREAIVVCVGAHFLFRSLDFTVFFSKKAQPKIKKPRPKKEKIISPLGAQPGLRVDVPLPTPEANTTETPHETTHAETPAL